MKRTFSLWILAFSITAASAVYQRMTGPTYPVSETLTLNGKVVTLKFERSHGGETDFRMQYDTHDPSLQGFVEWKRHKTNDPWTRVPLTNTDGRLTADLPHQPPAGKLDYRVTILDGPAMISLPTAGPVVVRFKGDVPTAVLLIHVLVMFGAMLFSTRTGLEVFAKEPKFQWLAWWTVALLFAGGMVLGPVVQKYAFDAYWTGWPFGNDLTDNKTAAALLSWIAAAWALKRAKNPKRWVVAAALITLAVFLIPHSVLGSELDYSKAGH